MSENLPNKNLIDLCREKMTNENIYAKGMYLRRLTFFIFYFNLEL